MSSFTPATFLNRQWRWATLIVIAGTLLFGRLGVWQLSRRVERREANETLSAQLAASPISLNSAELPDWHDGMAFQQVEVRGEFDLMEQIQLIQRTFQGQPGKHLIAPFKISGRAEAILVDRGWIPNDILGIPNAPNFPQTGQLTIRGYLKPTEKLPNRESPPLPTIPQTDWFRVDIPGIQAQLSYPLLPYYILPIPDGGKTQTVTYPFQEMPAFDLSEGSHLSYAIQWFIFAGIFTGGYIYFVWQQTKSANQTV